MNHHPRPVAPPAAEPAHVSMHHDMSLSAVTWLLPCGVVTVHPCDPKPTVHAAIQEMPKKKEPTDPSEERPRLKFEGLGFFLTPALHEAMKVFAAERKINVADVYREATEHFLEYRKTEKIGYWGAPLAHSAARVSVLMAEPLRTRIRAAAKEDTQALGNTFETAVRLYLALHQRPGF